MFFRESKEKSEPSIFEVFDSTIKIPDVWIVSFIRFHHLNLITNSNGRLKYSAKSTSTTTASDQEIKQQIVRINSFFCNIKKG